MRIGIISPSKISYVEEINPKSKEIIIEIAKQLAKEGHEIVVTPDKGSVSELFAQEYIKNKGKKVFSIIPLDDEEFGISWINTEIGEKINCGTWRNQPEKLNEETEALVQLGYSVGGLAEICYTKWLKPKPVFIIKELITQELPKELERSLNLKYVSYHKLKIEK